MQHDSGGIEMYEKANAPPIDESGSPVKDGASAGGQ